MKKAVMQFTACCLAVGMTVSSFGAVALADKNSSSMTLAGLSEKSTVVTSTTLAGLSEANTVVVSRGAESTAADAEDTETETAAQASEEAEVVEGTEVSGETAAADTEDNEADTTETGSETDASDAEADSDGTADVTDTEAADSDSTADATDTEAADSDNTSDATDTEAADSDSTADAADSETDAESTSADAAESTDATGTLAGVSGTDSTSETAEETETETELVYDSSMSGELAFAQCENYINVRADASADSEVVGKVYNNGSVTILGQLGDWYEVQSGNVTGYVNAEFFATGEEADEIANAVAYNVATVNAEGLWIHTEASEDSETIGMAYSSDQLEVVSYEGDWMKVVTSDGTYGYINAWYVDYDTYYSTAETLEEEQERLDQEWLEYLAEQEAEQAAAEAAAAAAEAEAAAAAQTEATYTYTETEAAYDTYTSTTTTDVDAAYQAYLEAQEAADEATHQADEQLVYDTYDAAVAAYQEYLDAVNAANAAAAAETEATYTETEATYTYTETEAAYVETEATYTETEATYTETEAAVTTTSSSSSTGQSIANYAVQFVGNPYVYGGTSLTNGADCSGFTQSVFANFGISIPRTAASQASSGTSVSLSDIQAGDLLFYSDGSGISHVALYIGGGQVVHASTSSTGIIISSYNYRTPVCARRYWS